MARKPGSADLPSTSASDPGVSKKLKAKRASGIEEAPLRHQGPVPGCAGADEAAPAPPGFNCNTAGCVGANAGLVCDTTTGQCVNCQTFADCGALQACFSGRCQGFVRCSDDGDCEGIAPILLPGPICNDNNESPESRQVCIFNPLEGACNNTNDCVPFIRPAVCVLGYCTNAATGRSIATPAGPAPLGRASVRVHGA